MDGLLVVAIIWFVFRMISANAKKQKQAQQKAEREEAGGYQPKPAQQQNKPRGWGEWADMLGKLVGEEAPGAQKPAAPTLPWQNDAAFPPATHLSEPTPKKIVRPAALVPTPAFVQEREKPTPAQPTREAPVMVAQDFLPERWDASTLVKGVIFSEILTRPVQRRRPGMPRMR